MTELVEDACDIFRAAVAAVQADRLIWRVQWDDVMAGALSERSRLVLLGTGKASMALAGAVEASGLRVDSGLVTVPHGYRDTLPDGLLPPQHVEVREAGHPVPDAAGEAAARQALSLAQDATADDVVLVLVSGGGSALWAAPVPGIALEDLRQTSRLLLRSGADIHAVNTVRRHLSAVGGGRLAVAAAPASVVALVLSDVVGDDLAAVASGPTVPDPTTLEEARAVLNESGLWEAVPSSVRTALRKGEETPKSSHPAFERTRTQVLGTNAMAIGAAQLAAEQRGYHVKVERACVTGEARQVGRELAEEALAQPEGVCLIQGGETTVNVVGNGKGGRNQEVALGAALALDGTPRRVVVLSGGTDGLDGPTDAAGAWVTADTAARARHTGLDPHEALHRNDAYPLFDRLGQLLRTGPTHTNVMDVQIVLVGGHDVAKQGSRRE